MSEFEPIKRREIPGIIAMALVSGGVLAAGIVLFVQGLRFDAGARCDPGESGNCVTVYRGLVTAADGKSLRVSFDDGRRSASVTLDSSVTFEKGERVEVEKWRGDLISLRLPRSGERARTDDWPTSWIIGGAVLGVIGLALVGVLVGAYAATLFAKRRPA